jgi:hypothetical protein
MVVPIVLALAVLVYEIVEVIKLSKELKESMNETGI